MKTHKLGNTLGVLILCLLITSSAQTRVVTLIDYQLSQQEVDFSNSDKDQKVIVTLNVNLTIPMSKLSYSFEAANGKKLLDDKQYISTQPSGVQTFEIPLVIGARGGDGQYRLYNIEFATWEARYEIEYIYIPVKGTIQPGPPIILSHDAPESIITPRFLTIHLNVRSFIPASRSCLTIYDPDQQLYKNDCYNCYPRQGIPCWGVVNFGDCEKEGNYSFKFSVIDEHYQSSEDITFEINLTSPYLKCWKSSASPSVELRLAESNIPGNKMSRPGTIELTTTFASTSSLDAFSWAIFLPPPQIENITMYSGTLTFAGNYPVEQTAIEGDTTLMEYKFTPISYDVGYWHPRGIYSFNQITVENVQKIKSELATVEISVEYPKAPWIEIILQIKQKNGKWKEEVVDAIEEFLVSQSLKESTEVFLQDKFEDEFKYYFPQPKDKPEASQIQLYLGNLEEQLYKEIIKNPTFFSALHKNQILQTTISSHDQYNSKPIQLTTKDDSNNQKNKDDTKSSNDFPSRKTDDFVPAVKRQTTNSNQLLPALFLFIMILIF